MRIISTIIFILLGQLALAAPLETTITYQGELVESGVVADGEYDFEFRVFDVASGGVELVAAVEVDNLQVTAGVFTAEIDFGPAPFTGNQLWLQIGVRAGTSVSAYSLLLPRQKLTATPYALHAEKVSMNAVSSSEIADGSVGSDDVDATEIQFRISGTCPPGSSIRAIDAAGNVTCEDDTGLDPATLLCPPEQVMIGFQVNGELACVNADQIAGNCPISQSVVLHAQAIIDFIVVADNSASMSEELNAMESALNGMAATLDAINSDYRFIMLNDHGDSSYTMCIPSPLSNTVNCAGPAVSGARFFHYDVNVQSHDSLCIVLDAYSGAEPDEFGLFENGYSDLLRPEAYKVFIELSDDGISCTSTETSFSSSDMDSSAGGQTVSIDFDSALLGLSAEQFGTSQARRYSQYGMIGVPPNGAPDNPYSFTDSVTTSTCQGAVGPGTGYQWLAKGTQAQWFSQCETTEYASMLDQIAIAANAQWGEATCDILVTIDSERGLETDSASLIYTPGGGGSVVNLNQVDNEVACTSDGYYFETENKITLCPAICSTVQADSSSDLTLDVQCTWPPAF